MSGVDKFMCVVGWLFFAVLLMTSIDKKSAYLWIATFGMLIFMADAVVSAIKRKP